MQFKEYIFCCSACVQRCMHSVQSAGQFFLKISVLNSWNTIFIIEPCPQLHREC